MPGVVKTPNRTYPEHEKLAKIKEQSQWLGNFIEWLQSNGYVICQLDEDENICSPVRRPIESWLAEYFKISLTKLEDEKQQLLSELRRQQCPE